LIEKQPGSAEPIINYMKEIEILPPLENVNRVKNDNVNG